MYSAKIKTTDKVIFKSVAKMCDICQFVKELEEEGHTIKSMEMKRCQKSKSLSLS